MRGIVLTIVGVVGFGSLGCPRNDEHASQPPPVSERARSSEPAVRDAGVPPGQAADATASDPCVVAGRAERSDLRACYVDTVSDPRWDVASSLEITVSPAEVKTTAGGMGDLVVHYANRTDSPVVLVFDDAPWRGHVVAHHADGRRADGVEAPPPPAWATSRRRVQRVTLGPKAVLDENMMWFASSWMWQTRPYQKQWPRSLRGPLPKGAYTLQVRTQLIARSDGQHLDYAEASTGGRVE
ncbi:MAG: hypothetical protein NT062_08565 [Proteobacteria bacterium]|nr:hypothetical protein [Pseudomonadota bacterium]